MLIDSSIEEVSPKYSKCLLQLAVRLKLFLNKDNLKGIFILFKRKKI
jgi:hypothetical protein